MRTVLQLTSPKCDVNYRMMTVVGTVTVNHKLSVGDLVLSRLDRIFTSPSSVKSIKCGCQRQC